MRRPIIIVSRATSILLGASIGGIAFAIAGLILGFYSFTHWAAGICIILFVYFVLPKIIAVDNDEV